MYTIHCLFSHALQGTERIFIFCICLVFWVFWFALIGFHDCFGRTGAEYSFDSSTHADGWMFGYLWIPLDTFVKIRKKYATGLSYFIFKSTSVGCRLRLLPGERERVSSRPFYFWIVVLQHTNQCYLRGFSFSTSVWCVVCNKYRKLDKTRTYYIYTCLLYYFISLPFLPSLSVTNIQYSSSTVSECIKS